METVKIMPPLSQRDVELFLIAKRAFAAKIDFAMEYSAMNNFLFKKKEVLKGICLLHVHAPKFTEQKQENFLGSAGVSGIRFGILVKHENAEPILKELKERLAADSDPSERLEALYEEFEKFLQIKEAKR